MTHNHPTVSPAAVVSAATSQRVVPVDVLRGVAIVLMIGYHASFDLNYHGWIQQDFNHAPFWLTARAGIVSLFLLLVGISLVLNAQRTSLSSFWRRQARLLAACLAVSLGSYLMFPQSFIFFGILHFILLASLAGRLFVRFHYATLAAAVLVLLIGISFSHPLFNTPVLQWMGLMTFKPFTEDYVPFFPWFGVVLAGIFIGRLIFNRPQPEWLNKPRPGMRSLALVGRHSLAIYLLHQPILLGIMEAFT